MVPSTSLNRFVSGPLQVRYGGSVAAQQAALALSKWSPDSSEEDNGDLGDTHPSRFVLSSPRPLFSYQQELVDLLALWVKQNQRQPAVIVSLPTGGGKTRTGLWFFRSQLEQGIIRRMIWVAPSTELVQQAVDTIKALWREFPGGPDLEICVNSLVSSNSRSKCKSAAAFVTAQRAARKLEEVKRFDADLLIFDEAHQAVARTFQSIVRSHISVPGHRVVGLSATPGRTLPGEGDDLQGIFGDKLITSPELGRNPVDALRKMGVLARLEIHQITLPEQWSRLCVRAGNERSLSVSDLSMHPARFWATVNTIANLDSAAKTIVFCASLAHCCAMAGALQARGIRATPLSHQTPALDRSRILASFAAGDISVILNKTLLATGFDCPAVTDIILATPIRSAILWEQILGRASRGPAVGGTEVGRAWELDDHRSLHGTMLSYARFLGDLWS